MGRKSICVGFLLGFALLARWSWAQPPTGFELDNGLDVILLPLPAARNNVLVVLYDIGHRHDPSGFSGMAHLAEHLYVTAATENTPARTVHEYIARYPDGWNAQTGDDYTLIATVFNPDRMDDELADAADRMRNIHVARADLQRELPRIDIELDNMYRRIPMLAVANQGRECLVPLAHQGRRGGISRQLENIDVSSINQRLDRFYKPVNATLVVAGVFEPGQTRAVVQKQFGDIESGQQPAANPTARRGSRPVVEIALSPVGEGQPARAGYTFLVPDPADELFSAFVVHAARLMAAGQKSATAPVELTFQWRPLDDPGFCYASLPVAPGETPQLALQRLDAWLARELSIEVQPADLARTENMMGMFFGLGPMRPAVLAMNPYGAAFSAGRRHQMDIDSARLTARLAAVDELQMRRAAEQCFGSGNRVTVIGLPNGTSAGPAADGK